MFLCPVSSLLTCHPKTPSARVSLHGDRPSGYHWYRLMRYAPFGSPHLVPPMCLLFFASSFSWICTLLQSNQLSSVRCTFCHILGNFFLGIWLHSMYTLFAAALHWLSVALASMSTFLSLLWLHQLPWGLCMSFSCWLACSFALHRSVDFYRLILASLSSLSLRL